jgi:glycerate kinase
MGGHVVIAPDKFKGSLTAAQAATAMARGVRQADPTITTIECPVADGGDGTLDAVAAAGCDIVAVTAPGPTGRPVRTGYARRGTTAVIEMADVCGLQRIPDAAPAPMDATSRGLGVVVTQALDDGCRDIVIGVGGSASTDGGAGLLTALGAVVRDRTGTPVGPGGRGVAQAAEIDLTRMHPAIGAATFTVAVDVDNPLCGPHGAAAVYAPQKGADPRQVVELDTALQRWADVVEQSTNTACRNAPGAGAAGGVGFAALAVLHARMRPGIQLMLDLIGLDRHLAGAHAVLTGEGSLDHQSLRGKAPIGVCRRARAHHVPAFAVVGVSTLSADEARAAGFDGVSTLRDDEPDPRRSIANAAALLTAVSERLARTRWTAAPAAMARGAMMDNPRKTPHTDTTVPYGEQTSAAGLRRYWCG